MTTCSELADYEWLTGDEAASVLGDLAGDKTPLHTSIARLRSRFTTTQTHLLIEQTELRRRAAAKFTQSDQMFFTRIGLEQATDEWVAAYKANRFKNFRVADLCCGIGGDLRALAARSRAAGIDRDPIAAHFAHLNAKTEVRNDDATKIDVTDCNAWHIDPDRRPTGQRTTSLDSCVPDRVATEQLLARNSNAAIKLAPATKLPAGWLNRCEFEWISRDGECKQLVAWHGALALTRGQHRATVLQSGPGMRQTARSRTVTGAPKLQVPIINTPARFIFDVDPAVLAAKLKGALAVEHGLSALSTGPTYLTGDAPITDPALSCFEVTDVLPFRADKLSAYLRSQNIGQLEIKKRGLDLNPESLRRQLKLRGTKSATLLITPIANRLSAVLANRIT
jgi:hypothetical protein